MLIYEDLIYLYIHMRVDDFYVHFYECNKLINILYWSLVKINIFLTTGDLNSSNLSRDTLKLYSLHQHRRNHPKTMRCASWTHTNQLINQSRHNPLRNISLHLNSWVHKAYQVSAFDTSSQPILMNCKLGKKRRNKRMLSTMTLKQTT